MSSLQRRKLGYSESTWEREAGEVTQKGSLIPSGEGQMIAAIATLKVLPATETTKQLVKESLD